MAETTETSQSSESGNVTSLKEGPANLVAWAAFGLAVAIGAAGWILHGSQATQMTGLEKRLTVQRSASVDRLQNQVTELRKELSRSGATIIGISGGLKKLQTELKGIVVQIKRVEQTAAAAMSSIRPAAGAVRNLRSDLNNLRKQDANSARSGQASARKAGAEIAVLRSRLAAAELAIKAANARALDALKSANDALKTKSNLAQTSDKVAKMGRRITVLDEQIMGTAKLVETLSKRRITALDERMMGTVKRVDALSKQLQSLKEQVAKTETQ